MVTFSPIPFITGDAFYGRIHNHDTRRILARILDALHAAFHQIPVHITV
jgi:hypothetical protein